MQIIRRLVWTIALLALLGCASGYPSMMGRPVAEAEHLWGDATRSWEADHGQHIYVWTHLAGPVGWRDPSATAWGSVWKTTLTTDAAGLVVSHDQVQTTLRNYR